jgi:hypothetical protein
MGRIGRTVAVSLTALTAAACGGSIATAPTDASADSSHLDSATADASEAAPRDAGSSDVDTDSLFETGTQDAPVESETGTILPYGVISSDYSRVLDRLVILGTDGKLHVLDPRNLADTPISVGAGSYVAVSPDGLHAAVALEGTGTVAYCDLSSASIANTYATSPYVPGYVLFGTPPFLYAFPAMPGPPPLLAIDLESGQTSDEDLPGITSSVSYLVPGVFSGDGTTLYAIDHTCTQLAKITFVDGGVGDKFSQTLPKECCGTWLSANDSQLFLGCNSVLTGVPPTETASLSAAREIASMDFHSADGTVAVLAVPSTGGATATQFQVYDAESLALQSTTSLPPLRISGTVTPTFGVYVFHDAAGTSVFAIVAASPDGSMNPTQLAYAILQL